MSITYKASGDSTAEPPVDIFVVVPGGKSFQIAQGDPQNMTFEWTPAIPTGTGVLLIAGDKKGLGTGGSSDILTVGVGSSIGCLASANSTLTATTVLPEATQSQTATIGDNINGTGVASGPGSQTTGDIPNKSSASNLSIEWRVSDFQE